MGTIYLKKIMQSIPFHPPQNIPISCTVNIFTHFYYLLNQVIDQTCTHTIDYTINRVHLRIF